MKTLLCSLVASALGAALSPLAAATVTVGPAGSGAPFSDIQPAIDAAQPGDTILVLPGTYSSFQLTKALSILGAGAGQVTVGSPAPVVVMGVPAGFEAVLSGFLVVDQPSLQVAACAGSVTLHDVVMADEVATDPNCLDGAGVVVSDVKRLMVLSCELHGLRAAMKAQALRASDSEVWLVDTLLQGGHGTPFGSCSQTGGVGLDLTASDVYLARSLVRGGDSHSIPFSPGGAVPGLHARQGSYVKVAGGPGARIEAGIYLGGSSFFPVPAAVLWDGSYLLLQDQVPVVGDTGVDPDVKLWGASVFAPTATVYPTLGGSPRQVALGGPLTLDVAGNPSALAIVGYAPATAPSLGVAGIDGALALDPAAAVAFATLALGPGGAASLTFPVPTVTALAGTAAFFQALELASPVQAAWSNPLMVAIP